MTLCRCSCGAEIIQNKRGRPNKIFVNNIHQQRYFRATHPDYYTAYKVKYYKEHKAEISEKRKAQQKQYRLKNRTRLLEDAKIYRDKNKDSIHKTQHEWYQKNKTFKNEQSKLWQLAHPEETRIIRRRYLQKHPERFAARTAARRALISSINTSNVDYDTILHLYDRICYICYMPIPLGRYELAFDHVIPLKHGGAHNIHNIRPTHFICNSQKRDSMPKAILDTSKL